MQFVKSLRNKWERFLRFRRNCRLLRAWATGLAAELSRYDIEIDNAADIQDSLTRLESKIQIADMALRMGDMFKEPGSSNVIAGPFQRRVVSTIAGVSQTSGA